MIIIGQGALNRADGAATYSELAKLAGTYGVVKADWNGFNVLHTEAALVGALDIGFVPADGALDTAAMLNRDALDVLFLLGVDEVDVPDGAFVIYQGTHGDRGAHRADVILPGATFTEKSGLDVNTEGRVQLANRAIFPPGEAREDWSIIRALSGVFGKPLPFDTLTALRKALYAALPHFVELRWNCKERCVGDCRSYKIWRHALEGRIQVERHGSLSDQRDCACVEDDGGMFISLHVAVTLWQRNKGPSCQNLSPLTVRDWP